jgi:hypothetical protein
MSFTIWMIIIQKKNISIVDNNQDNVTFDAIGYCIKKHELDYSILKSFIQRFN